MEMRHSDTSLSVSTIFSHQAFLELSWLANRFKLLFHGRSLMEKPSPLRFQAVESTAEPLRPRALCALSSWTQSLGHFPRTTCMWKSWDYAINMAAMMKDVATIADALVEPPAPSQRSHLTAGRKSSFHEVLFALGFFWGFHVQMCRFRWQMSAMVGPDFLSQEHQPPKRRRHGAWCPFACSSLLRALELNWLNHQKSSDGWKTHILQSGKIWTTSQRRMNTRKALMQRWKKTILMTSTAFWAPVLACVQAKSAAFCAWVEGAQKMGRDGSSVEGV